MEGFVEVKKRERGSLQTKDWGSGNELGRDLFFCIFLLEHVRTILYF